MLLWLLYYVFILLALISTVIIVIISLYLLFLKPFHVDLSVPGPKRTPFLGVMFDEASEIFGKGFGWDEWPTLSLILSRRYKFQTWGGPTINIGFGGAFFNIVSPDCLQYILRENFTNYEKGNLSKSFHELFGKAAFTTDGDEWKFHRRTAVSFLNKETSNYASTILLRKLEGLESFLDKKVNLDETLDLQTFFRQLTMDVFIELGFGRDSTMIEKENGCGFATALDEIQSLIHDRFVDIFWEFKQRFVWGEREKRIKICCKTITNFSDLMIEDAKIHSSNSPDFVSRYLKENSKMNTTNEELRNFIISMIIGGRDTTAAGITWTFYELSKNPTVVQNIRNELDEFSISRNSFSMDAIHKLRFTRAVVMEALRLHAPAPESFRFAKQNDVLPDGTCIPAGSLVMFSLNTINNSDQVWDNPSTFNPERFLNPKYPSQYKFTTFSAGPRMCPGQALAIREILICVTFLLSRYDFVDVQKHDGSFTWALIMSMKNGFPVKIRKWPAHI